MQLAVHGKQMDVGDALRTHVQTKLEDLNAKFFNRAIDTVVTFAPEGHAFTKTHISIRIGKDITVQASDTAADPYGSFDSTAEKIAKQLRRYKTRLRDHHERVEQTPETEMLKARDYILASEGRDTEKEQENDVPVGDDPLIVAEAPTQILKMSVADAVMRLDLSGQSALLFRNPKSLALNMIYRRADGNIGWVEPNDEQAKKLAAAE